MKDEQRLCVVGAGFAGAVLARELAVKGGYDVLVVDERPHVAGNCHTYRDDDTGIMVHAYGPHIFNTSRADVWEYVNRWATFGPYINRVKAVTGRGVFSLPINLLTINQFFNKRFSPAEAEAFIGTLGDRSIDEPRTFEEQALKMVGKDLYETFFKGYTRKQWGVAPAELPASILKRLPVRFNYDDNYYDQRYQGIPVEGYTALVQRILDHPNITVRLGTRFHADEARAFKHTFFSGPLDQWFDHASGRLRYRSLTFKREVTAGDHQGNPVMNYCEERVPYTRVAEHKHFAPWEKHERSVYFTEYSTATGKGDIPYYPMRLEKDKDRLAAYTVKALAEHNVTFIGRLGTYRYLDMHVVIAESLDLAARILALGKNPMLWPRTSEPAAPMLRRSVPLTVVDRGARGGVRI